MTEYEVHRLIMISRAEFDLATLALVGFGFAAIGLSGPVARQGGGAQAWLTAIVLTAVVLAGFRTISAVSRFVELREILREMSPLYHPDIPVLQLPTFYIRMALLFIVPTASVYFIWSGRGRSS